MLKSLKIIIASTIVTLACQSFASDQQSGLLLVQDGEQIKDENSTAGSTDGSD